MLHKFWIVFEREIHPWEEEYFEERRATRRQKIIEATTKGEAVPERLTSTQAILDQIEAEINENPVFENRFKFSKAVTFHEDEYYCLGQIDYEGPDDIVAAWKQFQDEFQVTYDEYGMAGHYQLLPSVPNLSDDDKWNIAKFAPPWTDK